MKKMLSLAAMFAALSYAAPASAALNFGGDASIRLRNESYSGGTTAAPIAKDNNDLMWQYRVRLNAAADLGDGYYFKAMLTDETNNSAGGWVTVDNNNTEKYTLNVSNFYFGRTQQDCRWAVGRLPLNSFNNPIFDVTLFPFQPLETPFANVLFDRVYGFNYGGKFLSGDLRGTIAVLDNSSKNNGYIDNRTGDGKLNDDYVIHIAYTDKIGDVTIEPQFLRTITHANGISGYANSYLTAYPTTNGIMPSYSQVSPYTLGANITIPAGKLKIGLSGFYTHGESSAPGNGGSNAGNSDVNYSGYMARIKAEYGNFMCFYDHNRTTDFTPSNVNKASTSAKYTNNFVWAQYKVPVYKSAAGSITVQPTLRYLTNKAEGSATNVNDQRLRSELWATVTF